MLVLAPDLIKTIEGSILTFHSFLKMDKKKTGGVRNLFVAQNQMATPLQQIQASLDKVKLKCAILYFTLIITTIRSHDIFLALFLHQNNMPFLLNFADGNFGLSSRQT